MAQTQRRGSESSQMLLFARNFFKHPVMLGSVIPSSRFLIRHLMREISWKRARVIVEYGPGVGTITRHLLRRMRPDARLLVFETNADFVEFLRAHFPDPRLHVVHGSAAEVGTMLARMGVQHADYVISGIPFSTMPDEVRQQVLQATRDALRPDGAFLVYQFSRAVYPHLERVFRSVRQDFEPLNILPAHLFFCTP
ncbi:MAG TPA: methyltransferase domain-containing protein [Longimicrobiaceae bacterium]|nr:methyltransferase domain-containing protein [Longimicrobiaceae bacterium]